MFTSEQRHKNKEVASQRSWKNQIKDMNQEDWKLILFVDRGACGKRDAESTGVQKSSP